jgi:isoleucyl-tRNA synthetase
MTGKARLTSFVQGRNEWCISRQRAWGVPIPALYNEDTDEALLTPSSIDHIISVIREKGIDAWFASDQGEEWVAPEYRGPKYRRGLDTLDVWFDSGTSWSMLPHGPHKQADLYLEGVDQHRGWFQSSLLTSMATQGIAPYRQLITHGFVVDRNDQKMSKSRGNIVSPNQIVSKQFKSIGGIDLLRLWVASSEYTTDLRCTPEIMQILSPRLSKARNVLRHMLGCLNGFDGSDVNYSDLSRVSFLECVLTN